MVKFKTKVLSVILSAAMLFTSLPATTTYGAVQENPQEIVVEMNGAESDAVNDEDSIQQSDDREVQENERKSDEISEDVSPFVEEEKSGNTDELVLEEQVSASTQNDIAIEDADGIEARTGADIVEDYFHGKMLSVNAGWISGGNSAVDGGGVFKNAADYFKKTSFTFYADMNLGYAGDASPDNTSAVLIGNEQYHFRIIPLRSNGKGILKIGETEYELSMPIPKNQWVSLAITYDEIEGNGKVTIYLDGEQILAPTDIGFKLSELENIIAGFGVTYKTGYMRTGKYDNVVVKEGADDAGAVNAEATNRLNQIQSISLWEGVALPTEAITTSVDLPMANAKGETISWKSGSPEIIGDDGVVVNHPDTDTDIIMTGYIGDAERDFTITVKNAADVVNMDYEALTLLDTGNVVGNLPLIATGKNGSNIDWESDNTAVVTDTPGSNDDIYDGGLVIRPEAGEQAVNVHLKARITTGNASQVKEFDVTVQPKAADLDTDYTGGYVFAHFRSSDYDNDGVYQEEIYFGNSKDGLHWGDLNVQDGVVAPVLKSEVGTKGVRDPHIIRSPEGDKYWIIATDLRIEASNPHPSWGEVQTNGSQSLVVWESTDLVNWGEARLVDVNFDTAGCTWAPEAIYDESTGDYLVYWASRDNRQNENAAAWGTYGHRIYCVRTRDFNTFSEPEVFIDYLEVSGHETIDTTIVEEDGVYYRISKDETTKANLFVETSNSLNGPWTRQADINERLEGPTCYKLPNGKWCLMIDNFTYYPIIADTMADLAQGNYTKLNSSEYSFTEGYRHGTVMALSKTEYNRMVNAYGGEADLEPDDEGLLARYNFTDESIETSENKTIIKDSSQNGMNATLEGENGKVSDGVLTLPGGGASSKAAYVSIPGRVFKNQDTLTITMWLKNETGAANYAAMSFGTPTKHAGGGSADMPLNYWLLNPAQLSGYFKSVWTNSNNSDAPYNTETAVSTTKTSSDWAMYTTVITPNSIKGYYNGKQVSSASKTKTTSHFGTNLVAYIGRSGYNDIFYKGGVRDVKIYGTAMTANDVMNEYIDTNDSSIEEKLEEKLDGLTIATKVMSDIKLPTTAGKYTTVEWSTSDSSVITKDGKIIRPAEGEANGKAILTAKVTYNDGVNAETSKEKKFQMTVLAEGRYLLMAYTNSEERSDLGKSLHLAYSSDGKMYTALNSNTGICFANNAGGDKNVSPNVLTSNYIFRKADGTYGLIATQNDSQKYVYVFDSEDLVNFTNERKLTLSESTNVTQPQCSYDKDSEEYVIYWKDGSKTYKSTTKDLKTLIKTVEAEYAAEGADGDFLPKGAVPESLLDISQKEYDTVVNKLGTVKNVGVEGVSQKLGVIVNQGDNLTDTLPGTVSASYSDGSTASLPVQWNADDLAKVDTNKAGTYTISGTVSPEEYVNPFIEQRADPCILKGDDGYYYFTASYPMLGGGDQNGYDKIVLRRSETIAGLAEAEEITIWDCDNTTGQYRYIWAPEIRLINGDYYVYYTASVESQSVWGIRPHVLKCENPEDIMNPTSWVEKGRFQAKSTDSKAFNGFSLDMTYFENNGHHYAAWAQTDGFSSLFIAEIDPNEPWKCISDSVKISVPQYSWERIAENVDEGPSVVKKNGKIFMAFSASGTGPEYCVGLLTADENADLLDAESWVKTGYPVLTSSDVPGEYGPGHNSFTVDENGNDIFVYHARGEKCYTDKCNWASEGPLYDPCRDARLKRVHWAADGTPILKMSYSEELADEFKTVQLTITVEEKQNPNPGPGPSPNPTPDPDPTPNPDDDKIVVTPDVEDKGDGKVEVTIPDVSTDKPDEEKNVTVELPKEDLQNTIQNSKHKEININVTIPDSITNSENVNLEELKLPKEVLQTAKEEKKDITVTVTDSKDNTYSWSFSGKDVDESKLTDVNLKLEIRKASDDHQVGDKLHADESGIVIDFAHKGVLPAEASVTIDAEALGFRPGDKVTLYYYNEETGKLEAKGKLYKVDKDGKITVKVDHCSKYVLKKTTAIKVDKMTGVKTTVSAAAVKVSWKKNPDATGYRVYRYNTAKKKYEKIADVKGTSYTDKGLKSATAYRYAVRAYVTASKTYYSAYTGNLKALTKPAAPASVKAKRTSKVSTKSTATISFKKVDKASTYRIYKYNKKTKKYAVAYRVVKNKLYQYNSKTKKYKKIGNVKVKNGILTCSLKNLNLKAEKSQKYVVKATVSKSGYTTQYSANSKAVTIK